jgi:hypothetical protein
MEFIEWVQKRGAPHVQTLSDLKQMCIQHARRVSDNREHDLWTAYRMSQILVYLGVRLLEPIVPVGTFGEDGWTSVFYARLVLFSVPGPDFLCRVYERMAVVIEDIHRHAGASHVDIAILDQLSAAVIPDRQAIRERFPSLRIKPGMMNAMVHYEMGQLSIRLRTGMRTDFTFAMSVVRDTLVCARIMHWVNEVRGGCAFADGLDELANVKYRLADECGIDINCDALKDINLGVDRFSPSAEEMIGFIGAILMNNYNDMKERLPVHVSRSGVCLFEDLYYSRHDRVFPDRVYIRSLITTE